MPRKEKAFSVLKLTKADLQRMPTDTLALPVCEDVRIHDSGPLRSLLRRAETFPEFQGKAEQELFLHDPPRTKLRRALFLGIGPKEKITPETLRVFAGKAVQACLRHRLPELAVAVPSPRKLALDPETTLRALMEGAVLANYRFDRFKSEKKKSPLARIHFMVPPSMEGRYSKLPLEVETVCGATCLARDWVCLPANEKTPRKLADTIRKKASAAGLSVRIMTESELKQRKMNALLAVAAGSDNRPCLVTLEYAPKRAQKTIALVGKGVTFDTGGIDLKPSGSLDGMKADMAGAAAVAAAMIAATRLKPAVRIIGALPLVENMVSGSATRPGDIIRTYLGKTVEIGNTDAEGRLILADAMAWVVDTHKPDFLIDLATLTGACLVALGEKIAGLFSFDDPLAEAILKAGEATFERCWRMPLPEDYKDLLKSEVADIRNIGPHRWGAAIAAALFLSEFVGQTPWAHLDIAGPAYLKKAGAYWESGGTGFGVRLIMDLLNRI